MLPSSTCPTPPDLGVGFPRSVSRRFRRTNVAPDADAGAAAASTFRLDVKGAEIREALTTRGIRTVLLKGPALARMLYPSPRGRPYSDVDLLVNPATLQQAEQVLSTAGFRRFEPESAVRQTDAAVGRAVGAHGAAHGSAWLRERDSFVVDLHDSLPQCGAPARMVWDALAEHLDVLIVAGVAAETLDRPASALLVALHAAHHGPGWGSALVDLEAALTVFDRGCWEAARDLAVTLHAEEAMGVGLGLSDAGRALARGLSLPTEPASGTRLRWAGAPWSSSVLETLIGQRGLRMKTMLVWRVLWPSPDALRRGSALARRGRRGLLAAYAVRLVRLACKLPAAQRARRHDKT